MKVGAKRSFIYALLISLLMISMLDRINMSVAGSSIANEMDLSPTALGCTGSFTIPFIVCGVPAVPGAVMAITATRGAIGAERVAMARQPAVSAT